MTDSEKELRSSRSGRFPAVSTPPQWNSPQPEAICFSTNYLGGSWIAGASATARFLAEHGCWSLEQAGCFVTMRQIYISRQLFRTELDLSSTGSQPRIQTGGALLSWSGSMLGTDAFCSRAFLIPMSGTSQRRQFGWLPPATYKPFLSPARNDSILNARRRPAPNSLLVDLSGIQIQVA